MNVVVIDYNAGNVRSVLFALRRLGVQGVLSADKDTINQADKVIFPGVGEASSTMAYLKKKGLDHTIRNLKQPVLGICLGMQLLCEFSAENNTSCLGIIPQKVLQFNTAQEEKVPHVGWNQLTKNRPSSITATLENEYVYFVHSFFVEKGDYTTATCHYQQAFSAALQKDNFHATQFHPEKSGNVGELILQNFLNI